MQQWQQGLTRWWGALAMGLLVSAAMPVHTPLQAQTAATGSITGVVHDSLAGWPLPLAMVQVVGTDDAAPFGQTVPTDSLGRYRISGVPDGQYRIAFYHPVLDSIGVEPASQVITVRRDRTLTVDLATPSAATLRTLLCGRPSGAPSTGVLLGTLRDASTQQPIADGAVQGEWLEYTLSAGRLSHQLARRVVRTTSDGWFVLCQLPGTGTIRVSAQTRADSTERLELDIPTTGVIRRELFLGSTATPAPQRLAGRVLRQSDGRPLADALVTVVGGPQVRTNARGEWLMTNAPAGSRTVELRAVGYYPARRVVDILDSTPVVDVTLATMQSVLDTVKVVAQYEKYRRISEFQERRRTGAGRYLTAEDIALRSVLATSELFVMVPGLFVDRDDMGQPRVLMRGTFSDRCQPAVYLNGSEMLGFTAADLDIFVKPEELAGIEVYTDAQAPAQFRGIMTGCGSLVLWTR